MSLVHRDPFGIIYIETAFTCEMKNVQTLVNGIWITFPPHVAQLYSRYLLNRGKKKGDAVNYKAITWTATANLLPCAEGSVALDLGRTCLRATCSSPERGSWPPRMVERTPHLISGWLWRLLTWYYTTSTLHVTQRTFLSLSATFTDLLLLDKAIPCTTTGCSCLASYFRNVKSHVALLNAFAVLLQGI